MSNTFDEVQRKIAELEAIRPSLGNAAVDAAIAAIKAQIGGISGTANVTGTNYGQNVGVNTGTISQNAQNINNQAPNQGAQGTFSGPVSFNQGSGTTFNQQGQTVQGGQHNAGRDIINAGRDVTQVGGDYVRGDTVGGDKISSGISVSGASGTGFVIGHKGQVQVQQSGDADAFARAFAQIYEAINTRQPDPNVDKEEITKTVKDIQEEAQKGDAANEKKLSRWLTNLAGMAEDIFEVTIAALTGPQAAAATVARKVAEKAKQEQAK